MGSIVLVFAGLFIIISAITVAGFTINVRKKRRIAYENEQRRKAELQALERKQKVKEDEIRSQMQELLAKEDELNKKSEILVQENERLDLLQKEITTKAKKIAEERSILELKENEIRSTIQELSEKEGELNKRSEILIQESERVESLQTEINTKAKKVGEERAIIEAKAYELAVREKQLIDMSNELQLKTDKLSTYEETLKKTSEELSEKESKLSALKEEVNKSKEAVIREKEKLDMREKELKTLQDHLNSEKDEIEQKVAMITEEKKTLADAGSALKSQRDDLSQLEAEMEARVHNIKSLENKISAQRQELTSKEDTLEKEAESLIREREDITTIRKELITETERIAEARAILEERTKKFASFEERLKLTNEELEARDLNLNAKEEEIETRAAAIFREKEELYARDAELKTLQDELKAYKEEIDLRIVSIIKDKKNLAEECSALKRTRENLEKLVEQLEAKLKLCEEHRHKTKEERKPLEEGEQQATKEQGTFREAQEEQERKVGEDSQEGAKKEPLPPGKRGGRPRGEYKEIEKDGVSEIKTRSLNPEVICWKEGWSWVIGIEVPEDLESQCVTQNEELLERDNVDETRYHLKQADGIVRVTWTGGAKVLSLMQPKSNYLIFKMRKNWKHPGRLVQRSAYGYYLIIAPQEWERDKEIAGSAMVNPEGTQLEGYRAHFFYMEQNSNGTIGFITANGERIQVESEKPLFQLVGNEITDACEDMGPLFGGQPPSIQSLAEKGWSNVEVIVVGEEGKGKNRWRTQFSPQLAEKEQKLPEELTRRLGGWYFMRIYDNNDNLLESVDFRFMERLKDIKVHSHSFLPGPSGHQPVRVEFVHKPRCHIRLVKGKPEGLQLKHADELMSAIIPSHPAWDVTDWEIRCGSQKVISEIMIERIWWSLTEDDSLSATELLDSPLRVKHDSISAVSKTSILLWFPKPGWMQTILVGFEKSRSRAYSAEVNERNIRIPLREFSDSDEIENQTQEVLLRVWFVDRNAPEDGIVICKILPKKESISTIDSSPKHVESHIRTIIEPNQMPCCHTCDHARKHHINFWCRRYHWPQVSAPEFTEKYERFRCAEWRGEYFNPKHKDWKRRHIKNYASH